MISNNDVHVYPELDRYPHDLEGTDCPCKPTIEVHGANLVIIHNAWDHREYFEQAVDAMNVEVK
jgi:hypothetical protein